MSDFFADLVQIATPIFAISSMIAVGLGNPARKLIEPLRQYWSVLLTLIANFVLVPAIAWMAAQAFSLDEAHETGLLIVGLAAGAPFLIKLTQIAGGSVALAATLLVLLLFVTIAYVPLVLPLVVDSDVEVDTGALAGPLVWTMLGPLAIGLALRQWVPDWALRIRPYAQMLITPSLIVLVIATFISNADNVISIFGEGAILAAAIVIGGAWVVGYLAGSVSQDHQTRAVVGFATAQRNMAAATVVATQTFEDPNVLVMVVVTSIVAMAVLFPTAFALGRRAPTTQPRPAS